MKILFVCQYYTPEPFRHPDICEELVKRGHEVSAVTGVPNYPMGKVYDGYKGRKNRDEIINGVKVHRCFTVARRNNAVFRLLNYFSFSVSATHYVKRLSENFDVVFVNQLSPVMMANPAIAYKRRHNVPVILYCLDLWPESIMAAGISKDGLIYKLFHRISEKIYRNSDKILVTSPAFSDYFEREFGIRDTEYLPQYAEDIFTPEKCGKTPNGYIDLMFAGNVGAAQDVDTIIEAAKLLTDIGNLRIHIVGDGSELDHVKSSARNMPQVIFHGRQPLEKMPEYYSMADAMLVTLKRGSLNATLPGKVQTCLAAGKPVIAAADGETEKVIKASGCGFCGAAGDTAALAENIRKLIGCDRETLINNSESYYAKNFSKQAFAEKLERALICSRAQNVSHER